MKHLSGNDGIEHMECAIADTRSKYFQAREKGSPLGSPITSFLSPGPSSSSVVPSPVASLDETSKMANSTERPSRVVRSLFREDSSSSLNKAGFSPPRTNLDVRLGSSGEQLVVENELIVNEVVHEQHYALADCLDVAEEGQHDVKVSIST